MKKENSISINKVPVGLFVVCFNLVVNSNGISPLLGSGFSSILSKKKKSLISVGSQDCST